MSRLINVDPFVKMRERESQDVNNNKKFWSVNKP